MLENNQRIDSQSFPERILESPHVFKDRVAIRKLVLQRKDESFRFDWSRRCPRGDGTRISSRPRVSLPSLMIDTEPDIARKPSNFRRTRARGILRTCRVIPPTLAIQKVQKCTAETTSIAGTFATRCRELENSRGRSDWIRKMFVKFAGNGFEWLRLPKELSFCRVN